MPPDLSVGRDVPRSMEAGFRLVKGAQDGRSMDGEAVEADVELSLEWRALVDRVIVPLLVNRLLTTGHLYTTMPPRYDADGPSRMAA